MTGRAYIAHEGDIGTTDAHVAVGVWLPWRSDVGEWATWRSPANAGARYRVRSTRELW
jgi:hypothetical protein